ncbi:MULTISPECIES: DUF6887 family protein [Nostoc]|uniref:Uncharacterized protein n=1 Tax=Nostoc paludosum FACHB-159 TaxID=2692908 RepID=A0ABR8KHN0_9NOSO|nr:MULTISPECIES: hypothetical protein [Nostoc]MBD2682721.1 hypothetical protein [Nostoc sp. FACHB-857]MBD2739055.1 hypothetical protein [Nostoc paludosum FACHB-159]
MSKPDFLSMSRTQLRKYILEHSEDEQAFQIYLDRFQSDSNEIFPAPQTIDDLKNFPELQRQHQQKPNQT